MSSLLQYRKSILVGQIDAENNGTGSLGPLGVIFLEIFVREAGEGEPFEVREWSTGSACASEWCDAVLKLYDQT